MKKISCIILLFIFNSVANAQTIVCAYSKIDSKALELCDLLKPNAFASDNQAQEIIQKILQPIGLKPKFNLVSCKNVNNCAALFKNNVRYILYDNDYLNRIEKSQKNNFVSVSILAHELAHHFLFHTVIVTGDYEILRTNELAADEFSGFVMCKLGYTLNEAQTAINQLSNQPDCDSDAYYDHPCKVKRLEAIKKGFKSGGVPAVLKIPTYFRGDAGKVTVEEFGGSKYGVNYCSYSCDFSSNEIFIDLANSKAILNYHYTEKGLMDCPLQVAKPTNYTKHSTYFKYDKSSGSISIIFESDKDFGLVIAFTGNMKNQNQAIVGNINIERPVLNKFQGYHAVIPIALFEAKQINVNASSQFKQF